MGSAGQLFFYLLCMCVCFFIIIIIIIINLQSSTNIFLPQKIFTCVYYDTLFIIIIATIINIIFITTIIIKNNDVSSLQCFKIVSSLSAAFGGPLYSFR